MRYCDCCRMCSNCYEKIEDLLYKTKQTNLMLIAEFKGLEYNWNGKLTILPWNKANEDVINMFWGEVDEVVLDKNLEEIPENFLYILAREWKAAKQEGDYDDIAIYGPEKFKDKMEGYDYKVINE